MGIRDTDRVMLVDVPRIGFYHETLKHEDSKMRCPEDVPFPSCLRACLEYLGDGLGCRKVGLCTDWGLGCGYAYLMGTTGAGFHLSWKPGWHDDNCASWLASDDPTEIFRRAFASVGRDCEILCGTELREQGANVEGLFRTAILDSIGKGRPVIAHGVVGPPEECIVAGYDEGGDTLIGWNFFQDFPDCHPDATFEPNGMFRKSDWLEDTWSLLVIGDKLPRPDIKEVYRDALAWALEVIRTPVRQGDRHNGLAAYDAWADHLLRDEEFPTDDLTILNQRFGVHDDAVSTVAEGRWYAGIFLAQAAMDCGLNAPALYAAASCCAAEHDLMWKVWGLVGGLGRDEDKVRKLADPDVRKQIVPIIHAARDREAQAANHIERALAT
ncbi:hypothetical protein HQ560_22295 [bacterium]|nr:hypothetical protein [bacterium]